MRGAALLALAALLGCNLPTHRDDLAVEYQYYAELLPALRAGPLHQAVTVGTVTAHPDFAAHAPTRIDAERVRAALVESLHRTALLAAPDETRYQIDVELIETTAQQVIADLIVTATARYTLRDTAGAIRYSDTLVSDYSIDATDEPFRLTAWERAYVGAVRNNMTMLIKALTE